MCSSLASALVILVFRINSFDRFMFFFEGLSTKSVFALTGVGDHRCKANSGVPYNTGLLNFICIPYSILSNLAARRIYGIWRSLKSCWPEETRYPSTRLCQGVSGLMRLSMLRVRGTCRGGYPRFSKLSSTRLRTRKTIATARSDGDMGGCGILYHMT